MAVVVGVVEIAASLKKGSDLCSYGGYRLRVGNGADVVAAA